MAKGSGIEWTESTWNPVTGCTKISPGCKHCYAERMAERLQAMGQPNYADGFKLTLQSHTGEGNSRRSTMPGWDPKKAKAAFLAKRGLVTPSTHGG